MNKTVIRVGEGDLLGVKNSIPQPGFYLKIFLDNEPVWFFDLSEPFEYNLETKKKDYAHWYSSKSTHFYKELAFISCGDVNIQYS